MRASHHIVLIQRGHPLILYHVSTMGGRREILIKLEKVEKRQPTVKTSDSYYPTKFYAEGGKTWRKVNY